ncbi:MAG TPA: hypothetical protein VE033_10935 [Acetobacteraceae bacterium]|jgi:hypothetical protein|nr:hypothetical protein [Acetobacteraceae bacterium]
MQANTNGWTLRAAGTWRTALLGLPLALGACAGDLGGAWHPFSRTAATSGESLTVQRLRGANPEVAPVQPEQGNVWPEGQEGPRATLANPDEAMRNIPEYRPTLLDPAQPTQPPVGPRRGLGSSAAPPGPIPIAPEQRFPVTQPAVPPSPPPPRADGRPVVLPDGRVGVTTGGTDRVQGFVAPGGDTGTVIRDGRTETVIQPGGRVEQRVAPR